ncbi:MAG: hypothetical protein QXR62_01975 [Candidatus Bathyarchaeia archaeon]
MLSPLLLRLPIIQATTHSTSHLVASSRLKSMMRGRAGKWLATLLSLGIENLRLAEL